MLAAALQYAGAGWSVFPCRPRSKIPLVKWKDGATTDPDIIRAWWTKWPNANVAIKTGGDLVVIDLDSYAAWQALPDIPTTFAVRTGRGAHLYFKASSPSKASSTNQEHDAALSLRSCKVLGVELKAAGSYVLAPPSIHPSGDPYTVLHAAPVADLPQHIQQFFQAHARQRQTLKTRDRPPAGLPAYLHGLPRTGRLATWLAHLRDASRDKDQEIQRVKSALEAIPASCAREDWIRVGMILRDCQYVGEGGVDLGLEIWDNWSQTTTKPNQYPGRTHIAYQWNSFRGRAPGDEVTLGTLFELAYRHGWAGGQNTDKNGQAVLAAAGEDDIILADSLLSTKAPRRSWLVNPWIPAEEVTLLAGDGGTGKSTIALQLAVAMAGGTPWFDIPTPQTNVLYVSAEDPRDEIHWRLQEIHKHTPLTPAHRRNLIFMDLTLVADPVMVLFDRAGKMNLQDTYKRIEDTMQAHDVHCVIIDAAADVFGGSEIDRRQVRAFLSSLRMVAIQRHAAIILIAHPSVDAMKTDRGYSGSTAWNNSVRSRLWFKKYKPDDVGETDMRVLELGKSNRAQAETRIIMRWQDGRFVSTSAEYTQSDATIEEENGAFRELFALATKRGLRLSLQKSSRNYAPAQLVAFPRGKAVGYGALVRAMGRLVEAGEYEERTYGRPSRPYSCLVVVTQA